MAEPFLGEIRFVSSNFAPKGWALCNGQLLPIVQNQALFSILLNYYGGDGRTTFALPNLMGRVPLAAGNAYPVGTTGGEVAHALTVGEMPAHRHTVAASTVAATQTSPAGNVVAADPAETAFAPATDGTTMRSAAVGTAGSGSPHNNLPPYLTLTAIIATSGIYPTRS